MRWISEGDAYVGIHPLFSSFLQNLQILLWVERRLKFPRDSKYLIASIVALFTICISALKCKRWQMAHGYMGVSWMSFWYRDIALFVFLICMCLWRLTSPFKWIFFSMSVNFLHGNLHCKIGRCFATVQSLSQLWINLYLVLVVDIVFASRWESHVIVLWYKQYFVFLPGVVSQCSFFSLWHSRAKCFIFCYVFLLANEQHFQLMKLRLANTLHQQWS